MGCNIDFTTIPDIDKKISEREIHKLNEIFQQPEVVEKLKEIEEFRKKRQKVFAYITVWMVIITLLVSYFIGKLVAVAVGSVFAVIMIGLFFHVGTGDNSFSTIEGLGILWTFLYWGTYAAFRSKIEIPLKRDIMSRVCKTLHETFEYSYDAKYSFDDLALLRKKKFLNSYTRIKRAEDSIELIMEKDKKGFLLNWFELETTETRWSGKNRRTVTTNHDYLIKIVFPYARMPIESDLLVEPDKTESKFFLFRWFGFFKKKRIILEDVEFEKFFDVRCDDEVSSRMILTPAFMNKMTDFVKKTGNTYSFLFTDNTVYIKRKIHKKYMEVGTSKNIFKNVQGFLDFYIDMREVLLLSKELHFMYLSNTTDNSIERAQVQNTPIAFIEKAGFSKLFWFWSKTKSTLV